MFALKIKELRKNQNLTQQDLADILKVSRSSISKWETKTSYPDITTLVQISDHFSVSLDYLLKGDVEMTGQLDKEVNRGRFILKWYIELPLFIISFFGITLILNNLLGIKFNIVTELITAIVFYCVYKYLDRKQKDKLK